MNKFEYKNLTPFKWFVLENFPFIEADFDALTEWQLFCKLGKEINKIIESQNVVGTEMEKFSQAFIELQNYVNNYFENLDVQEEINNKLNGMSEDGTLQEIISAYLNSKAIFAFNTVNEMKNATNLINGSYAKTLGYYEKNDGGEGFYKIRNYTSTDIIDNGSIIPISESLIAELITINCNVLNFGCYGNGTNDDSDSLQKAITYAKNNKLKLYSPQNKKYLISQTIDFSGLNVDFNKSEILSNNEITLINYNSLNQNFTVKNLVLNGNNIALNGLNIIYARTSYFSNIFIKNFVNDGIIVLGGFEIYFNNIYIEEIPSSGHGFNIQTGDSVFENITTRNVVNAFLINAPSNIFNNIHSWMSTGDINNSKMFIINVEAHEQIDFNNIYSDTMRYVLYFNNKNYCYIYINNLNVAYNSNYYTKDKESSILFYCQSGVQSSKTTINYIRVKGLGDSEGSLNTKLSNIEDWGGSIVNSKFFNTLLNNYKVSNVNSNFTIVTQKLYKANNSIFLHIVLSYDTSKTSGVVNNLLSIPSTLAPLLSYESTALFTKDRFSLNESQDCYLYVTGDGNNFQIHLPTGKTGKGYIIIKESYVRNPFVLQ